MEETIHERLKELDEREAEVDLREAALQADVEIRTDKIEARERRSPSSRSASRNRSRARRVRRQGTDRDPAPRVRVVAEAARARREVPAAGLDGRRAKPARPLGPRRSGLETALLSPRRAGATRRIAARLGGLGRRDRRHGGDRDRRGRLRPGTRRAGSRSLPVLLVGLRLVRARSRATATPAVAAGRYAFFPLWPWLIRASGSITDWERRRAPLALVASGLPSSESQPEARRGGLAGRARPRLLAGVVRARCSRTRTGSPSRARRGRRRSSSRRQPLAAGLLGAAAAMLRPNGVLIALPLALARPRQGLARTGSGAARPLPRRRPWRSSSGREATTRRRSSTHSGSGAARAARARHWVDHLGDVLDRTALAIAPARRRRGAAS